MSTIKVNLTRDMPDRSRVVAELEMREDDPRGLSDGFSLCGLVYRAHGTWSGKAQQEYGRGCDSAGQCVDDILRAFPGLAQFASVHLSGLEGEPMRAESNGWYWYAGNRADLRAAVVAAGGYTGFDSIYAWRLAECGLSDDDAGREEYCRQLACEILRVDSIPDVPSLTELDSVALREAEILREQAREIRTVDFRDAAAVCKARELAAPIERDALRIERAAIADTFADARAVFRAFVDSQRERWHADVSQAAATIKVAALLRTDNPSETAGEWSTADLAAKLPQHSADEIAAALEALPVSSRYVGGVSEHLYTLPKVAK